MKAARELKPARSFANDPGKSQREKITRLHRWLNEDLSSSEKSPEKLQSQVSHYKFVLAQIQQEHQENIGGE